MSIIACSLGCKTFQTSEVNCTVNNVFVNEEIRITFSQAIDFSSLKTSTFQVRDTASGLMPPGTFSVDPSDPRGVVYRPLLTFNSSGTPVFGLVAGRSYEILLPGTNLDAGPFITSANGKALGTRMRCVVTAGGGINDPVAGAPTVSIRVNEILKDAFGDPVIDPATMEPFLGPLVAANNGSDIHRRSNIEFIFTDVMNPATLVNKVTGQSPSLRIFVDPDGDVSDSTDWVELFGTYDLLIDQTALTTTVTFDADTNFPSAGDPMTQPLPRRIIVSVPTTVVDLGGNSVANAADVTFVPERITFMPVDLPKPGGEDFTTSPNQTGHMEDTTRSGAVWGPASSSNNELEPGVGGGSGRLGDLVLGAGTILTLYTDGMRPTIGLATDGNCGQTVIETGMAPNIVTTPQFEPQLFGPDALVHDQDGTFATIGRETFQACIGGTTGTGFPNSVVLALANDSRNITTVLIDNYDPATTTPGTSTFQVTDGIYEFASLDIAPGAVLRFVGPNPARLFVRGDAILRGRIELNGKDADQDHSAQSDLGGVGAAGGPGGGAGGNGGMRPDGSGILLGLGANATNGYPGGTANPLAPTLADLNGQPGVGFEFPSGTPGSPLTLGGGPGGTRWPDSTVCSIADPTDCGIPDGTAANLTFTGGLFFNGISVCTSNSMGGPGGGGGRALPGGPGIPVTLNPADDPLSIPPATGGGSQLSDATAPALAPEFGFLRGGAGGGGSGAHAHGSATGPMGALGCDGTLNLFVSNSGAGGGGGGGALQFQAGARIVLDGVIDVSGGKGGEPIDITPGVSTDPSPGFVVPAGSGSGGSILIQTLNLLLPALNNRLDITGGVSSTGLNNSIGGAGSPGFVHVQAGITGVSVPTFNDIAALVTPFDPAAPALSNDWVSINSLGWRRLNLNPLPSVHPITGATQQYVPDVMSGAQSCWMRPDGNFFNLRFIPDNDGGNGLPGWTMSVRIDPNEAVVPEVYRVSPTIGSPAVANPLYFNSIEGGIAVAPTGGGLTSYLQDPEATMGGALGSQFIVRFQGARAVKDISNLCDVPLTGSGSPIQAGSLTPWVLHPAELNGYWDLVFPTDPGEASKRKSTMIRYQIIFNRRAKLFGFAGVDNVTIKVQPD